MSTQDEMATRIRVSRALKGWKQVDVARKARMDPSALSRYEKEGGDAAPRDVTERIHAATEVSLAFSEVVVSSYRVLQRQASRPTRSERGYEDDLVAEVASRFAASLAPAFIVLPVPDVQPPMNDSPPTMENRAEGEMLFQRLVPLPESDRLLVVAKGCQFRTAALCERLCEESVFWAAKSADNALHWAELALRVAERIPGSEGKRARGMGYAWAFVGNSLRVANEFPAVDAAFAQFRKLYALGDERASGWFDEARALDLEASLRRNQGRFGDALKLLDRALEIGNPSLRTQLLLNMAVTLEQDGRADRALRALEEARTAIEQGEGGPRFLWVWQFNVVKNLVHLYRATEAEALLPELRLLAAKLGNDLDQLRTRALTGEVLAALRKRDEALADFSAVRAEFTTRRLFADAAVVGLHEAVILLEGSRSAKVRTLVRAMKPIFDSLGLKREALAAYRLFVVAVEQEAATATMARELAKAIERAGRRGGGAAAG
ncbi:MAG: hypothetical protein ABJC13_03020 [Acidobacteriota bacterium]